MSVTENKESQRKKKKILKGIPVCPGIIIGKAHLFDRSKVKVFYQYLTSEEQVREEIERFKSAVKKTKHQIMELKSKMPEALKKHSFIIDTHLMMIEDSMITDSTIETIRHDRINAEWALQKSMDKIRELFEQVEDKYIRERINDVQDVVRRLMINLTGKEPENLSSLKERVIIVAHDLSPMDTSEIDTTKIMGFITDVGGKTSHTAIMSQALKIPAVLGLERAMKEINDGSLIIVDGNNGEVIVEPDEETIIQYHEKQERYEKYESYILRTSHLPAVTKDGYHITIKANIEFLEEVVMAKDHGAEGIGLYRTEFLYLRSKGVPSEKELYEDYRELAELIAPESVTIRTVDLGGDKFTSEIDLSEEINPAMGLRAIRFCLKQPEIFKSQLRAILRASSVGNNIKIMFPMISGIHEIIESKRILKEVMDELEEKGIPFNRNIPVGIMIEIPSAVTVSDLLARHVDFFSIGTNDLIQYALAIDRVNEHVAYMYQPFHPAIIRMLNQVVHSAKSNGIGVYICGEMAGDPLCIPLMLGLEIEELSMNPPNIPLMKNLIRSISMKEIKSVFHNIMELDTASKVKEFLIKTMLDWVPDFREKLIYE